MEKESFAIFVDASGSVSGCQPYWQTVADILVQYAKDITHYYLWGSRCLISSKKQYELCIAAQRANGGGTSPQYVAQAIVDAKFINIILVTDGEVGDYSVKQCDTILENAFKNNSNYKLNKVICYVIGGYRKPNLSVTCPFTRFCESIVYSKEGTKALQAEIQYTKEDYQMVDTIEQITLANFEAKYDLIEKLIIAINMGKEANLPLKNQLVAMKTRLVKELSKKMGKEQDYSSKIREKLIAQDFDAAIEMVDNMAVKYFADSKTGDLEKKINHLISLCGDLRGQYSVDQIKSNKMATAQEAVEGKLDQTVQVEDLSKNPIECPIIMDEDVPQILIDECKPFLLGVEKGIVDDISACPLRILNYPDLKAKFKARLSTFTGVKYSDKFMKNPFTQNRLLGAIPLGTHKSHITVGNYTIAKMVSGGKIMGNLNMYMAVIWYLVKEDEIEYLKPIKANVIEHLTYRLKKTNTMASMCGLSQFVTTQISSDIALWYCVNSGYLNQPTEKDAFRFHIYNLEPMAQLVETLGYPIHSGFKRHFLRTKALLYFLEKYKRLTIKQRKCFKNLFRGLYQKGFFVDTSKLSKRFNELEVCSAFIPIDGEADEEQIQEVRKRLPKFCEGLTKEDLHFVSELLDEKKLDSEIFLDYKMTVPALPKAEVNWPYGLTQFEHGVKICPKTMRPYYSVEGQKWEEQAQQAFKIADPKALFKGCKYIQEFIIKYEKIPTQAEIAIFYYNRYVESGKRTTLPFLTQKWMQDFLEQYEQFFTEGKDVKAIASSLKKTNKIALRQLMEATV